MYKRQDDGLTTRGQYWEEQERRPVGRWGGKDQKRDWDVRRDGAKEGEGFVEVRAVSPDRRQFSVEGFRLLEGGWVEVPEKLVKWTTAPGVEAIMWSCNKASSDPDRFEVLI